MDEIVLTPIGHVINTIKERMKHGWSNVESRIVIDPALTDSIDGLEEFSHIIVLYWMHQVSGDVPIKVRPQGRDYLPLVGLFATRSPHRPNSIGFSVVRLLQRNANELKVLGLDAIDNTPILDIKPYLSKDDIPGAKYADWVRKLDFS